MEGRQHEVPLGKRDLPAILPVTGSVRQVEKIM